MAAQTENRDGDKCNEETLFVTWQGPRSLHGTLLARGQLSGGELTYLDALSDLVAAYEDEHCPIPPASDADLLRHLMEAKGITQTELSRATRIAKSTISEIVSGKRPFSRSIIRKLANYFKVDPSVLAANV